MMIYRDIEPQPKIIFARCLDHVWIARLYDADAEGFGYFSTLITTGADLSCDNCGGKGYNDCGDGLTWKCPECRGGGKFVVKSIHPVNRDGKWQWEIEIEYH